MSGNDRVRKGFVRQVQYQQRVLVYAVWVIQYVNPAIWGNVHNKYYLQRRSDVMAKTMTVTVRLMRSVLCGKKVDLEQRYESGPDIEGFA